MNQLADQCRARVWLIAITPLFISLGSACALLTGKEPGLKHSSQYTVSVPDQWKAKTQDESDYAYTLPSGNIVTVNSACDRDTQISKDILTRQLLIGLRSLNFSSREPLVVSGREGQFSSVRASNEGVPFFLNLFVLPLEDCIFDFTLVSPSPIEPSETVQFQSFVKSFHYGKN